MGRVARLLTAAAVAVPLLGSSAGPAAACACVPSDPKAIVHTADAIIAGRIGNQISLDAQHTRSIVQVQGVYRGNVPSQIFVDTDLGTGGGSSCAVLYPVGSVVDPMVLQKLAGGSYTIAQCVIGSMPHVRALLGAARPPPLAGLSPSASSVAVPVATSTPTPGMDWAAVGIGLVVAVVLIAAAVRFSGRRAVETASLFDDMPVGPDGDAADTSALDAPGPEMAGPDAPGPDASG